MGDAESTAASRASRLPSTRRRTSAWRRRSSSASGACGYLFLAHSEETLERLARERRGPERRRRPVAPRDARRGGRARPRPPHRRRSSAPPGAARTATSTGRSPWSRRSRAGPSRSPPSPRCDPKARVGRSSSVTAPSCVPSRRRRGGHRHGATPAPARRRAADRARGPVALPQRADPRAPARAARRLARAPLRREAARRRPRARERPRRHRPGDDAQRPRGAQAVRARIEELLPVLEYVDFRCSSTAITTSRPTARRSSGACRVTTGSRSPPASAATGSCSRRPSAGSSADAIDGHRRGRGARRSRPGRASGRHRPVPEPQVV